MFSISFIPATAGTDLGIAAIFVDLWITLRTVYSYIIVFMLTTFIAWTSFFSFDLRFRNLR